MSKQRTEYFEHINLVAVVREHVAHGVGDKINLPKIGRCQITKAPEVEVERIGNNYEDCQVTWIYQVRRM